MTDYLVTWEIDIDADTPEEAAMQARLIQLDEYSEANYFAVKEKSTNKTTDVDLCDVNFNERLK